VRIANEAMTERGLEPAFPAGVQQQLSSLTGSGRDRHCTQQQDAAQKVERRMRKSEAALLLESTVGRSYDAIVTGHSMSDTGVRIFNPRPRAGSRPECPKSKWVNRNA
jgi:hypothetical protein